MNSLNTLVAFTGNTLSQVISLFLLILVGTGSGSGTISSGSSGAGAPGRSPEPLEGPEDSG